MIKYILINYIAKLVAKIGKHDNYTALLEAQIASDKTTRDRGIKDVEGALRAIVSKLDSI